METAFSFDDWAASRTSGWSNAIETTAHVQPNFNLATIGSPASSGVGPSLVDSLEIDCLEWYSKDQPGASSEAHRSVDIKESQPLSS
jgi:hypothetical protein